MGDWQLRRRFSERIGVVKPRDTIQRESMDERLWSRLWTVMTRAFWAHFSYNIGHYGDDFTNIVIGSIQDEFLGQPVDEVGGYSSKFVQRLKDSLGPTRWAEVYDLAQFLADFSKDSRSGEPFSTMRTHAEIFIEQSNEILAQEKSAYRFVAGELVEITSDEEIESLEEALSETTAFTASRLHLSTALRKFGDRAKPDYRNAVKESISAVESAFTTLNGEKSNSLKIAIDKAERSGLILPPGLKNGIKNIYGWTSDESGIRHALTQDGETVGQDEAKLMIVLCAAFVNYLTARSPVLTRELSGV